MTASSDALTTLKKYVDAALDVLTPAKAQQIAQAAMKGQGKEQVTKFAQDLLERSHKASERVRELVRREVASQMKSLGVVTREDLDALKKRVRELERAAGPAKRTPARKAAARKPAAKRAGAAKATVEA